MKNRLVIEIHNNEDVRCYNTILPLSTDGYCFNYKGDEDNVTPIGHKIAKRVMSIPGVTELSIRKYSISVTKAIAFDWGTVECDIKGIIQENTTPGIEVRIKDNRTSDKGGYANIGWDNFPN